MGRSDRLRRLGLVFYRRVRFLYRNVGRTWDALATSYVLGFKIGETEREKDCTCCAHLLMRMTIVVMIAARKTKPPKTPKAMIPPEKSVR